VPFFSSKIVQEILAKTHEIRVKLGMPILFMGKQVHPTFSDSLLRRGPVCQDEAFFR
jgi:hypothetical protein